jgi:phage shock protein C
MDTRKLYRLPGEGMVGGVCAGLGEYFSIDPTIIRLLFVFLALAGMSGVLIYLILLLVVPSKSEIKEVNSEIVDSE